MRFQNTLRRRGGLLVGRNKGKHRMDRAHLYRFKSSEFRTKCLNFTVVFSNLFFCGSSNRSLLLPSFFSKVNEVMKTASILVSLCACSALFLFPSHAFAEEDSWNKHNYFFLTPTKGQEFAYGIKQIFVVGKLGVKSAGKIKVSVYTLWANGNETETVVQWGQGKIKNVFIVKLFRENDEPMYHGLYVNILKGRRGKQHVDYDTIAYTIRRMSVGTGAINVQD